MSADLDKEFQDVFPDVPELPLNEGQEAAAQGFFEFLFDDRKEIIISGGGGVGKTFLMGRLIDNIMPAYFDTCGVMGIKPEYTEVVMTATTNKAADVLSLATNRSTSTIHSFLNLKVKDDYSSGRSTLTKTNSWVIHHNKIIFIDECSMIDKALRSMILEGTFKCKIIYVGDHCQLAPVMEKLSPIYMDNLPFYNLTQPMRNADQPALMAICAQLRATVESGKDGQPNIFLPIKVVPGVIDWVDDEGMAALIDEFFVREHDMEGSILAYTNAQVINFNDHIRDERKLPPSFVVGEILVNNSAVQRPKGMISVEQEVEIMELGDVEEVDINEGEVQLLVRRALLRTSLGELHYDVPLPVDREHYNALVKYYAKIKKWPLYFNLKNVYPDLRPRDARTVHKSQGSSYDIAFIDLSNISTCHQADQAARMLYVAFTRARTRIVMYGKLADKYGGIIQ